MEQYIQNIFEWSPVGLLLFKAEDRNATAGPPAWVCNAANGAASNLLGQLPLEKRPLEELFPALLASRLCDTAMAHPLEDAVDFYVSKANRWLLAIGNRVEQHLTVTLTDITRQKEASFTDRRLMQLYQSLTASLNDHEVILFDRDFNIVLTEGQPRFIRFNMEDELNGRSLKQLFEHSEFSFLGEFATAVFGSDARSEHECEINGRLYKATLYQGNRDDETGAVGVLLLKDVTEVEQKQRELAARIRQLHRSNEELETFAYVASHDLQEPLRKIRSFGERLQAKYGDVLQGEGQMYINRMSEAAQRMEKLIDDLLLYSRATHQGRNLKAIDLGRCISSTLADLEIAIEETQARIEQPSTWPRIEAVPSQMEQLFQNLIKNSLRFAQKDVPPVVKISHYEARGSELAQWELLQPDKQYCIIRIEDNGIGFDRVHAEHIFMVFHRLNGRMEYEGSGIGLAICKKIVENHGGFIAAEGQAMKGAVFSIVLPLVQG
jgi:signal transduction histidine kinase